MSPPSPRELDRRAQIRRAAFQRAREAVDHLDELDVVWLAGLLEGRGSFGLQKCGADGARRFSVRLELQDRDVVERAASLLRVSACRPGKDGTWRIQSTGYKALVVAERLAPHMGSRRRSRIVELGELCRPTF